MNAIVRGLRAAFVLGAVLGVLGFAAPARAVAQESPGTVIESASKRILGELKQRRSEFQQSDAALSQFIRDELDATLDQDYSGRLVLGRHARSATPEQLDAFSQALSDNLLARYGRALLDVNPTTEVRVIDERELRNGRIVRVATEISRDSGAPIPVDYLFHETDNGWLAFDVIVEGISYVQTFRSQFDPLIKSKGLDAVITDLRAGKIKVAGPEEEADG